LKKTLIEIPKKKGAENKAPFFFVICSSAFLAMKQAKS
jgi:hypothetical protein